MIKACITVEYLLEDFMVVHKNSAPYHPQANGQAKSTNKILGTVLTRLSVTKDLIGIKVACNFMGLQSGVQDFNWNNAIQHGVWLRRYS